MEVNNNNIKTLCTDKQSTSPFKVLKCSNEVMCFLVACVAYSNGLCGDFVHDDIFAIKTNGDVTGRNPLYQTFKNDFWGKPMWNQASHKSYRPLTILTFRIQFLLCGISPFYFHVVNVLVHAAVTSILVWTCSNILYLPGMVPLLTGLLFAVHPIHVEAVTGLVGRAELLSAFFFLISFICYNRSLTSLYLNLEGCQAYFIISMVCGVVASLCKEQGIMVLPVCIVFDVTIVFRQGILRRGQVKYQREKNWTSICILVRRIMTISLIISCLLVFRWWVMNGQLPAFQHQDNPASFSPYLVTRCLTYWYIWFYNIVLLLFPSSLCYDWQVGSIPLIESFTDLRNLATLSMFAVVAFCTYKLVITIKYIPHNKHLDVILIIFMFSVLPFLPASNMLFRVGFVIAERTLYIPSVGYCIMIATGVHILIERMAKYEHLISRLYFLLILTLLLKTWTQNNVWSSRETLFLSGIKTLPQNAKVHYNYANVLKDKGQTLDAIQGYETAIRLYPDHASALNNLATLVTDLDCAIKHLECALKIKPEHTGALINLGARYFKLGNKTRGIDMLKRALEIEPLNVDGLTTLGGMMAELQRWEEAEVLFREAITEKPDFAGAYHNYGAYLHLKGEIMRAVHFYHKAYSLDNGKIVSMVNAARGLRHIGKLEEAHHVLNQVLDHSRDVDALDMLGLVYFQMGKLTQSLSLYEELQREQPNNTDITTHYAQVLANKGDTDKAERMLLNVLQTNPDHPEALHFLANVLGRKGNHLEALHYLEKAIQLQKDQSVLENMYFQQGNHYKDLRQYDKALKGYQKAVEIYPGNIKAHVNIGAIFHLQGDVRKAKKHYLVVLEHDPEHRIASQNLRKLRNIDSKTGSA